MIKGIIFDLFGTIIYEMREKQRFVEFAELIGKDWNDYNYRKLYEVYFASRKIPNFREPTIALLKTLNIPYNEELINKLVSVLNDFTPQSFRMYDDAKSVLYVLKNKYKLALLTNVTSPVFDAVWQRFKLENIFDGIVCSFQINTVKPDKRAFTAALNAINLTRDNVIYVGDSFKEDIRGAENFGMIAVLIDREGKHPQYENRIERLHELRRFLA